LQADQSLRTADPENSESTDPDYDDAEKIMRALHHTKVAAPLEELTITLNRSYPPRKWMLFGDNGEGEDAPV